MEVMNEMCTEITKEALDKVCELKLIMTSTQVAEKSVTNNPQPDDSDHTTRTVNTPGFKPITVNTACF